MLPETFAEDHRDGLRCWPDAYLSTTPQDFASIFGRKPNSDIDAGSWCSGFYAAIQLNPSAWAPLLTKNGVESGLLLPILRISLMVSNDFTRW